MGRQETIEAHEHKYDLLISEHEPFPITEESEEVLADAFATFKEALERIEIKYQAQQFQRKHPWLPEFSEN